MAEVTAKLTDLADSMRALDVEIETVTFKVGSGWWRWSSCAV